MLVTPAEVARFIHGLDVQEDDVASLIDSAQALVASWLLWPVPDAGTAPTLELSTYTEYHSEPALSDSRSVRLSIPAVAAVTSVYVDSTGDYDGDENENPSTDYVLRRDVLRLKTEASYPFPRAYDGTRIIYTAGWDPDGTVPQHVKDALILTVRQLLLLRDVEGLPNSATLGDTPAVITPEIQTLMGRYRRIDCA